MWLLVTPYFRQCMPPALLPTFPPRVETTWLPGSGTKLNPKPRSCRYRFKS